MGECDIPMKSVKSFMTELRNSLPLSETITLGTPCLHIQCSKKANATVSAFLSTIATSSVYFVNASVITMMYFAPDADLHFNGPNKSICTLKFGSSQIGKLCKDDGLGF